MQQSDSWLTAILIDFRKRNGTERLLECVADAMNDMDCKSLVRAAAAAERESRLAGFYEGLEIPATLPAMRREIP